MSTGWLLRFFVIVPPFNDSYIVTDDRSETCINKFLSTYAYLVTDEQRDDFAVLVAGGEVETGTLAATISYGLADASKSFALYFNSKFNHLKNVIVYFTPDGKLVLGLSTEYDADNDMEAERVIAMLKADFNVTLGAIGFETPPGDAYDWINKNLEQL